MPNAKNININILIFLNLFLTINTVKKLNSIKLTQNGLEYKCFSIGEKANIITTIVINSKKKRCMRISYFTF